MFKSSRKKLIAVGCSYTQHYLVYREGVDPGINLDFPRWPQHLADMLDMDCVNVGRAGAGNDYMLAKTLDATLKEKDIGLVVIMWSEWRRMGFQEYQYPQRWTTITPHDLNMDDMEDWRAIFMEKQNWFHATRNTLRTFIHAQKLLGDTPYIFVQGTKELWFDNDSFAVNQKRRQQAANEILTSPYLDYIESEISDKFIGWPVLNEIGGYNIDNILDKEDPKRLRYRISGTDTHPNPKAHKVIAEFLYEQYKEMYNEH